LYHDYILLADNQALAHRVGTTATSVLTAHPLWASSQISGAVTIHSKKFPNTDLDPLLSSEADAIHEWYRVLTHQSTTMGIALCPLLAFDKNHALWPRNLPSGIVFEMSSTLLLKLQCATIIEGGRATAIERKQGLSYGARINDSNQGKWGGGCDRGDGGGAGSF
jgi:hypothetical protein